MLRTLASRLLVPLLVAVVTLAAHAQEMVFTADPARSTVEFTLDATMHTVHGKFRLKSGELRFDPRTGTASGVFVVDAASGNSGNDGRDRKMHQDVLESVKYPEIRYTVQKFAGALPAASSSTVQLSGILNLHGADHAMTVTAPVQLKGGHAVADVPFDVPYVEWGMKNPSVLFLRVKDHVQIVVHAVGTVANATTAAR